MRYGKETRLSPAEVLDRARALFGEKGDLGLPETTSGPESLTFAAPSGGVNVSATTTGDHTEVTIISREYDYWAERFIRDLR